MEGSWITPKFLDKLWAFANQVKEGYKLVIRDYQLATYDMSFGGQVTTQFDEVSEFCEKAILYVEAAEEANEEEKDKK